MAKPSHPLNTQEHIWLCDSVLSFMVLPSQVVTVWWRARLVSMWPCATPEVFLPKLLHLGDPFVGLCSNL